MTAMTLAAALARHFEGLRLAAYPCPAGVPTIGYGHTAGVALGQTITADRAEQFLAADLAQAAAVVDSSVTVPLTDGQRAALIDFVFNVGAGRAKKGKDPGKDGFAVLKTGKPSTLLRKLNAGDTAGAAAEFGKWIYGGGRILPGLVTRRRAEEAAFRGLDWRAAIDETAMPQAVEPAAPVPALTRSPTARAAVGTLAVSGAVSAVSELLVPALQVAQQVQDVAGQVQGVADQAHGVVQQLQGLAGLIGWSPSPTVAVLATGLVVTLLQLIRERRARG